MDSKLNDAEITALQSLDPYSASDGGDLRDGDLPQKLFAFNLVARQPGGATTLTRGGERALFLHACVSDLAALGRGEVPSLATGVEKWLRSSGFISGESPQSGLVITPRGQLWLDSFEKDVFAAVPELTATHFAQRREGGGQ